MYDGLFQVNPLGLKELARVKQIELGIYRQHDERIRDGLAVLASNQTRRRQFFQRFRLRRFLNRVAPELTSRFASFF